MYRHTHYGRLSLYFGEEIKFIALNPTGVGDKDRTSEGGPKASPPPWRAGRRALVTKMATGSARARAHEGPRSLRSKPASLGLGTAQLSGKVPGRVAPQHKRLCYRSAPMDPQGEPRGFSPTPLQRSKHRTHRPALGVALRV